MEDSDYRALRTVAPRIAKHDDSAFIDRHMNKNG